MKAVLLTAPREAAIRDLEQPPVGDDEVLLRIEATGLCGSDISTWKGVHPFRRPPVVLGHEAAGVVAGAGRSVRSVEIGQRVALCPLIPCERCDQCARGAINLCRARRVPGVGWAGTYAEFITAPADVLYPVGPDVNGVRAALVEPAAVALRACRRAGVAPGIRIAVLGAGGIGSLCAMIADLAGASAILSTDVASAKLDRLRSVVPCTTILVPDEDPVERGLALTDGNGFDAILVASSAPQILGQAVALARPGGVVVVVGLSGRDISAPFDDAVVREITIRGSYVYDRRDFADATTLVTDGRIDVERLVTHSLPLAAAPEIFETIDAGLDYTKIIFTVGVGLSPDGAESV
jgi:L-iditol 2-dehydrogenase